MFKVESIFWGALETHLNSMHKDGWRLYHMHAHISDPVDGLYYTLVWFKE